MVSGKYVQIYKNYQTLVHDRFVWKKSGHCMAKSLALWKFDKPTKTRMVEDQIGCVIFFRKEY